MMVSYQALARKWRPKRFTEIVGQSPIVKALSNALTLGRIHHAYLFSGTRGVGKTSIARLFAKGLNCETGVTATPCGQCNSCQEIEQGRFIDLIEIDAASRTKVEDTRELLDNVQYLPVHGRYKVYLIDEVHMLSRSSFNALLKTLEEPPEHVKFLLATTDPQKLPVTILSRCLQLHLRALDSEQIKQQVAYILTQENISYDEDSLPLIARAANGSMRDALSLTDQAIALGNGQIITESVMQMLGSLDDEYVITLLEVLVAKDTHALMRQLQQIASLGVDWDTLFIETLSLLHQLSVLQFLSDTVGKYQPYQQRIQRLARAIVPEDLQLYYQMVLNGRRDLPYAPDAKMGAEMTFLRLLAFQPVSDISSSQMVATVHKDKPSKNDALQPEFKQDLSITIPIEKNSSQQTNVTLQLESTVSSENDKQNISGLTARILQKRQQLLESEKSVKKSETANKTSPVNEVLGKWTSVVENRDEKNQQAVPQSEKTENGYQWQFTQNQEVQEKTITPQELRQALDHERTPELVSKLVDAVKEQDSWANEIEQLTLPNLVKQLVLNTFKEEVSENKICLHLRSQQRHLNNSNVSHILAEAIECFSGQQVTVEIIEDDNPMQKTPLEWRQVIYQQKIMQAKDAIKQDKNIALICDYFDARIEEESIRPI